MQSCMLRTRRGETTAGLPAFSTLTTEGLDHPSCPSPEPNEDTASLSSPGPHGPQSRTKLPGTPHPKHGGSHHHLGSDTLTVSILPAKCLLCPSQRNSWSSRNQTLSPGRMVGLGSREWTEVTGATFQSPHVSHPPASLWAFFWLRQLHPHEGGLGGHLLQLDKPPPSAGAPVWALRAWADHRDLPVCRVRAFHPSSGPRSQGRGLGAPVPTLSLRSEVSGLRSPHIPRGQGLRAPVPPLEKHLEQLREAPALRRQPGAWIASWLRLLWRGLTRVGGWQRPEETQRCSGGRFRRMETARRMSGSRSSEATKVIKTSGDGSGCLPDPGVGSDHPGSLQPFGFLRPSDFSERPISSVRNVN